MVYLKRFLIFYSIAISCFHMQAMNEDYTEKYILDGFNMPAQSTSEEYDLTQALKEAANLIDLSEISYDIQENLLAIHEFPTLMQSHNCTIKLKQLKKEGKYQLETHLQYQQTLGTVSAYYKEFFKLIGDITYDHPFIHDILDLQTQRYYQSFYYPCICIYLQQSERLREHYLKELSILKKNAENVLEKIYAYHIQETKNTTNNSLYTIFQIRQLQQANYILVHQSLTNKLKTAQQTIDNLKKRIQYYQQNKKSE